MRIDEVSFDKERTVKTVKTIAKFLVPVHHIAEHIRKREPLSHMYEYRKK